MAGPWEKFAKTSGKPWERFQKAPIEEQTPPNDLGANAEASLQGFGQGATLGYLPQLQAAAEPALAKVYEAATGENVSPTEDYVTRRDQYIELQKKLAEQNPKSYVGGQLAGGLTTAFAAPGSQLGRGATLGAQTANALKTGIAIRGLQNPGDVQGEVSPAQLPQRIENAANPFGLATDVAIPATGPAFGKLSSLLKNQAERSAFKALGPYAKESIRAFGNERVNSIGRTALDTGLVGGVPKSYEAMATQAASLKNKSGQELGDIVSQLAATPEGQAVNLSRNEIAGQLKKELVSPNTDIAGIAERNAKMEGYSDLFSGHTNDAIPLMDAELKKRAVGQEINWQRPPGSDIPDIEAFNRALYQKLKGGVEQGGEQLAQTTGYDVGKFRSKKNEFGNLAEAENILSRRAPKEFANRLLSPSDYGVGAAGAAIGAMSGGSPEEKAKHAAYGFALALANKGARKYGNQISAMSAEQAAKLANQLKQASEITAQDPQKLLQLQMLLNQRKGQ